MNILVTGGHGFIGSHIVDRLARAHTVTVDDDHSNGAVAHLNPKARYLGPAAIYNTPLARYSDIECLVHCAARADIRHNWDNIGERLRILDSNVTGYVRLLEALPDTCRTVVFISTCAVYGDADNASETTLPNAGSPYAASKLAGEAYTDAYCSYRGIAAYKLRLASVFGPRIHHGHPVDFVRMATQDGKIRALNGGMHMTSAVDVYDVVDAVQSAVGGQYPPDLYNVAGGLWSWRYTVEVMANMAGVSIPVEAPTCVRGWPGDPMVRACGDKLFRHIGGYRGLRSAMYGTLQSLGWGL